MSSRPPVLRRALCSGTIAFALLSVSATPAIAEDGDTGWEHIKPHLQADPAADAR